MVEWGSGDGALGVCERVSEWMTGWLNVQLTTETMVRGEGEARQGTAGGKVSPAQARKTGSMRTRCDPLATGVGFGIGMMRQGL